MIHFQLLKRNNANSVFKSHSFLTLKKRIQINRKSKIYTSMFTKIHELQIFQLELWMKSMTPNKFLFYKVYPFKIKFIVKLRMKNNQLLQKVINYEPISQILNYINFFGGRLVLRSIFYSLSSGQSL